MCCLQQPVQRKLTVFDRVFEMLTELALVRDNAMQCCACIHHRYSLCFLPGLPLERKWDIGNGSYRLC